MPETIQVITGKRKVGGKTYVSKEPLTFEVDTGRIEIIDSPFALKDEIKALKGARCIFEDGKFSHWTASDHPRNWIQFGFWGGKNPLAHFDKPVAENEWEPTRYHQFKQQAFELMPHQLVIADNILSRNFQLIAADPGLAKTLATILAMERSGVKQWLWSGPKSSLPQMEFEFAAWGVDLDVTFTSHDQVHKFHGEGFQGFVIDEIHKCKTAETKRTVNHQKLADEVREKYGFEGYVVGLSGTPAPKTPVDWWAQAEIVYPGYLAEGSPKALLRRLAKLAKAEGSNGFYEEIEEWREDEVALLHERLKGLVTVFRLQDTVLNLPPINHRMVELQPHEDTLRVAKMIAKTATSAATAAIHLREISDGFLYTEEPDGMKVCPACEGLGVVNEWFDPEEPDRQFKSVEMFSQEVIDKLEKVEVECFHCEGTKEVPNTKRVPYEIPCLKEDALREEIDSEEELGRMLVFAGFKGSIDRIVRVFQERGWEVIRCDGRGFSVLGSSRENPLAVWADRSRSKVAYVAHPESGGTAFTLVEARKVVFYSNTHRWDHREQALKRVHRPGQTKPVEVVDLMHLPTDYRVLDLVKEKGRLEGITMGDLLRDDYD